MNCYPKSPIFVSAFWRYFRGFLTTLSAMVTLTPFSLTATEVLPTYAVHRSIFSSSASFLCMLAFSTVFYSRLVVARLLRSNVSRRASPASIAPWLRVTLLAVPVLLALTSGWAVVEYQGELSNSIELAKTIYFAEQRAPESDFAFREWQLLTSNSPEEARLSEMRRFQSVWPIPADFTRQEILDRVQVPPFTNILWFWYLLAFVCGELSFCLVALRCFQSDTQSVAAIHLRAAGERGPVAG